MGKCHVVTRFHLTLGTVLMVLTVKDSNCKSTQQSFASSSSSIRSFSLAVAGLPLEAAQRGIVNIKHV